MSLSDLVQTNLAQHARLLNSIPAVRYCGRRNYGPPLLRNQSWQINVLLLKPEVGQNIATPDSPSAIKLFLVLNFYLPGPFTVIFSKSSPYFLTALVLANTVFRVGPRFKINHPA